MNRNDVEGEQNIKLFCCFSVFLDHVVTDGGGGGPIIGGAVGGAVFLVVVLVAVVLILMKRGIIGRFNIFKNEKGRHTPRLF